MGGSAADRLTYWVWCKVWHAFLPGNTAEHILRVILHPEKHKRTTIFYGIWRAFQFFGAGGTIDLKGGGLRPTGAAYGFTYVSGFHLHIRTQA
jgi:hypothetical protein